MWTSVALLSLSMISMLNVRTLLVPMFVRVKLDLLEMEKLVQVGVFDYGGIDVLHIRCFRITQGEKRTGIEARR